MDTQELLDFYNSDRCVICNRPKDPERFFDRTCYFALPPADRSALNALTGSRRFFEAYSAAIRRLREMKLTYHQQDQDPNF
jgi:hypothetical protein